jgi:hypothetical protein
MKSKKSVGVKAAPAIKPRRKVEAAAEAFAMLLKDSAEARKALLLLCKVWREMSAGTDSAPRRLLAVDVLDCLADRTPNGQPEPLAN